MKLRYENVMEDLLAFQEFHYANSPEVRKMVLRGQFAVAVVSAGLLLILIEFTKSIFPIVNLPVAIGASVFTGVLGWFNYPYATKRSWHKSTKKLYSEGKNRGFVGWHDLLATEDSLISSGDMGETKLSWQVVERVESTPEFVFLYVSAMSAIIIPRARVTEGNVDEFLAVAQKNSSATPPR